MKVHIILVHLIFLMNVHLAYSLEKIQVSDVDTLENQYIPKNMKDCLNQLDRILPDSVKNEIKSMSENDFLNATHFGLGMWIRNNWGLWDENSRLYKYVIKCRGPFYHADFVSDTILSFYYAHLTGDKKIKSRIRRFERGKEMYD